MSPSKGMAAGTSCVLLSTALCLTLGMSLLQVTPTEATIRVIPPVWANTTVNSCAAASWQLLYWPPHNRCYHIFTQGPCKPTQELYFNKELHQPACRCSRGTIWHPKTERCYPRFSQGPCSPREYFSEEAEESHGLCIPYQDCSPGHLFWPATRQCFPLLSRGPCQHGHLLHISTDTGVPSCGCDPRVMSTNYWSYEDSCHELFTRGPCIQGHIFLYNITKKITECTCDQKLQTNYHRPTDRCYELETLGPCLPGQKFSFNPLYMTAVCVCLQDYIWWEENGHCYRAFSRGPCPENFFLKPLFDDDSKGECVKNMCSPGHLYHLETERCYAVGKQGPCKYGKLWVYEKASSIKGMCHCDPHLVGYWEATNSCYELGTQGPCPRREVLSYNRNTGKPSCRCDYREGYLRWFDGKCLKLTSDTVKTAGGIRSRVKIPADSDQWNNVLVERLHRALTLPQENSSNNSSLSGSERLYIAERRESVKVCTPGKRRSTICISQNLEDSVS